ncbi:MAG: S1C family serine protease [Candidatus Binatia bacterium]
MKRAQWIFYVSLFLFTFSGMALLANEVGLPSSPLWREGGSGGGDPDLDRLSRAFTRLAEKVRPAVVQVRVSLKAVADTTNGESQRPRNSRGSGFIINHQGFILTAHHVIDGAQEVEVRLADRQRFRGQVVAADSHVDLAIIKIDGGRELPILALGDSDSLNVGELVGSLGFPFGLESSLGLGIISRRGRSQNISAGYEFIQTDAGASSGNSGGPLVNMKGQVVGMITMASERGNMGFAVPINAIKSMIPRLLQGEKIVWGWLGVSVSEVTLDLADTLGLTPIKGVLVSSVLPGQPAEKAGVHPKDIILSINGTGVDSPREVIRMVGGTEAGREVKLTIFRKGETLDLSVRLGTKPKTTEGREG